MEDSSIITEEIGEAMASYVTMKYVVKLGPNTNILSIVKKHDHVKTGESLITFEHSFDDSDANKLLDTLSDEYSEIINDTNNMSKKTKHSGEIADVKVYYNVEEEICSPSIQKLINGHKRDINTKHKIINSTDQSSIILPAVQKVNSSKIKGIEMEGVMIEFYVRHLDTMGIGDKIVYG
jgi:hypothetical protein